MLLLLFVACMDGRTAPPASPVEHAPAPPNLCPADRDEPVFGWDGSPACVEGAKRWSHVPAADLGCATDADCAVVDVDTCFHLAVVSRVAADYRANAPCVLPNAGVCAPQALVARCEAGCCTLAH